MFPSSESYVLTIILWDLSALAGVEPAVLRLEVLCVNPIAPQGLPQGWIEHPVFCLQNKRFTTKLLGLLLLQCEITLSHFDAVEPLDSLPNTIFE